MVLLVLYIRIWMLNNMWKEQLLKPVTSTGSNIPVKPKRSKDCKEKFLKMIEEIKSLGNAQRLYEEDDDTFIFYKVTVGDDIIEFYYRDDLTDEDYCKVLESTWRFWKRGSSNENRRMNFIDLGIINDNHLIKNSVDFEIHYEPDAFARDAIEKIHNILNKYVASIEYDGW